MSTLRPARIIAIAACHLVVSTSVHAQANFGLQGDEYSLSGSLLGDQVESAIAVGSGTGILVWEDYYTDGDGGGISARLLDGTFSGVLSSFRVNEIGAGHQGKPDASVLSNGGKVLVWEGGASGFEDVYARLLSASNTWVASDLRINTFTNGPQEDPAVAALPNSECVIVWSSYDQVSSGSMKDVYFQRLSSSGQSLGNNILVNQTTALNQRSPSVARLSDGRFVVCWVSESRQLINGTTEVYSVDIYGRIFSAAGVAEGNEFKANASGDICANPSIAASQDGGFLVAWSQKGTDLANSWDVAARAFSSTGVGGIQTILNSYRYGDQFKPSAAAAGADYFVVWTSLRQDGSHQGVFGRFLDSMGVVQGNELQVNSTSFGQQVLPDVASDGESRFVAIWSGFTDVDDGFDIFGQRFSFLFEPLIAPAAPYVWPLNDSGLKISWATVDGFDVSHYELYLDGAATAAYSTTNNWFVADSLSPGETHSFKLGYVLEDGRRSPLSAAANGTTYIGYYYFGIPVEWMTANWGQSWPPASLDTDGDGASNYMEFLSGTDPNDPSSVLWTVMTRSPQGYFLNWNTEPGGIYQVQQSTDFSSWLDYGGARFAPGDQDSVNVGGQGSGLFRVLLLRN